VRGPAVGVGGLFVAGEVGRVLACISEANCCGVVDRAKSLPVLSRKSWASCGGQQLVECQLIARRLGQQRDLRLDQWIGYLARIKVLHRRHLTLREDPGGERRIERVLQELDCLRLVLAGAQNRAIIRGHTHDVVDVTLASRHRRHGEEAQIGQETLGRIGLGVADLQTPMNIMAARPV